MSDRRKEKPRSIRPVSDARGPGPWILLALSLGVGTIVSVKAAATPTEPVPSVAADSLPVEGSPEDLVSVPLPVEVNHRVDRWIHRYLTDQRPHFERHLVQGQLYIEMIREKLRARDMPEELIYLAMIESGFSPSATSRVSASGIWQFMSPTARAYGLRMDGYVDERRDPIRATDAALDYLAELHQRFDSWYLAAAAYNAGPTRVARVLRQHAGDALPDDRLYWEIIDHLPRETREYVPKILAATLLAREAEKHGFDVDTSRPYDFHRVFVPGGTSLKDVARSLNLSVSGVRDLNPHLVRGVTPPGVAYPVRVPVGTSSRVVAALNTSATGLAD